MLLALIPHSAFRIPKYLFLARAGEPFRSVVTLLFDDLNDGGFVVLLGIGDGESNLHHVFVGLDRVGLYPR